MRISDWSSDVCSSDLLSALNPQMITVFMQLVRTKPEDRDEKALKAATERAAKLWGILDKHLAKRPYVAGDRLTMGDIPLGVLVFRWFTLVKEDRKSTRLNSSH